MSPVVTSPFWRIWVYRGAYARWMAWPVFSPAQLISQPFYSWLMLVPQRPYPPLSFKRENGSPGFSFFLCNAMSLVFLFHYPPPALFFFFPGLRLAQFPLDSPPLFKPLHSLPVSPHTQTPSHDRSLVIFPPWIEHPGFCCTPFTPQSSPLGMFPQHTCCSVWITNLQLVPGPMECRSFFLLSVGNEYPISPTYSPVVFTAARLFPPAVGIPIPFFSLLFSKLASVDFFDPSPVAVLYGHFPQFCLWILPSYQ